MKPNTNSENFPPEWFTWIRVSELAKLEGCSRQEVYRLLDSGMDHSRHGDRIRVRRADFHRWHLANMVNAGKGA